MSEDADYLFALALQKRFNEEINEIDTNVDNDVQYINNEDDDGDVVFEALKTKSKYHDDHNESFLNRTQNLVHPEWEVVDPTPDIFSMFKRFNQKFFGGRLVCVTLEWSKRMYSCAGICYQRRNRLGMDVTVRLSEPLLKLRPRKDLVETMLHEMIHAYCFVLNIREGNGGHGPNFKKIMHAINKVAGTNITVYHTFNDEVDLYKQHWWRCNGICHNRTPFFGYVKRTSNRAPGPNDQWWQQHVQTCGGTFMKIKEPDKKPKKTTNKTKLNNNAGGSGGSDLKKYFIPKKEPTAETVIKSNKNVDAFKGPVSSGSDSMSWNAKTVPPKTNVIGIRDLNAASSGTGNTGNSIPGNNSPNISGQGYTLAGNNSIKKSSNGEVDQNHLRNVWSNRFPENNSHNSPSLDVKPNVKHKANESFDDVVIIEPKNDDVIELLSDSDEDTFVVPSPQLSPSPAAQNSWQQNMTSKNRQDMVKQEILDESFDLSFDDVIIIDDEYDDNEAAILAATELADTSVIDELFGEDTLMAEFQRENDVVPGGSRYLRNPDNDIISCAICQSKMKRSLLKEHLNGCMGIIVKIAPPKFLPKHERSRSSKDITMKRKSVDMNTTSNKNPTLSSTMDSVEGERHRRQSNLFKQTRQCPRCGIEFEEYELFHHFCIGE